ncbi:MAG: inner membrane protein YhjD [Actinomycetota bacterium]|nr:inner membrane protein YhjD [Actinomycetota bacterium]
MAQEDMTLANDSDLEPSNRSEPGPLKQRLGLLLRRRGVRHIVRALDRFNDRLGNQFAGAMTYFSFLAVVPILMVAFSIAGFVLSSRPYLLTDLRNEIAGQLPGGLSPTIGKMLDTAVQARVTVGLIGLLIALYSGVSWMGNLRTAIQAQWRPDFDDNQETREESLLKYYWKSLIYLLMLGVAISASLLLTAAGSWAQGTVLKLLGWQDERWLAPMAAITPVLLAVFADVVIFYLLYDQLSPRDTKPPRKPLIRGAVVAAVAFEALKLALTLLLPLLLTSTTAKFFGPVIGLLFFFNLVATVVLFLAAWIATAGPEAAGQEGPPITKREHVAAVAAGRFADPSHGNDDDNESSLRLHAQDVE